MKELLEEGKASQGSLPVNVAFVFEGEEENGSAGFEEAIQGNLHWFEGTQLIVISNTLWVGERVPCLTYGASLTCLLLPPDFLEEVLFEKLGKACCQLFPEIEQARFKTREKALLDEGAAEVLSEGGMFHRNERHDSAFC